MSELLYLQVADSLINRINNGLLQEDQKISERKLATEYQVSRTVIREAIKLLNEKGLVCTIYGKGSFVKHIDDKISMDKIQDTLDSSHVEQKDVLEARELIEQVMIPLIIKRVTQEDIKVLEELYQKLEESKDDGENYIVYDAKFHLALSLCTHNRIMSIMTGTLNRMANREQLFGDDVSLRMRANKEHFEIISALKEKNEQKLIAAMQMHISCIRSHVKEIDI
jgi:DNA-binding FadR family transcriptional regulator